MEDLEIAKKRLHQKNLTLSIVRDSEVIFESKAHGIFSLINLIENLGNAIKGASVADKVVGKAAALLFAYAGVKAVYAETLSEKAKPVFEKYGIYLEWSKLVEKILNASGKEICPFEKAVLEIDEPIEAMKSLKLCEPFEAG